MDNKQLGIIGAIIIIIVIIICAFAFLGNNSNPTDAVSEANASNSTTTNLSSSDGNYQLQINTTGKWRLDLTVNGNYQSDEGEGSKTIDLGSTLDYASVTVNQYENGPTDVYLLKNGEVIDQGSSNSEGIETIYFYYQA